jgi:plasmid stabilization system protein ParE
MGMLKVKWTTTAQKQRLSIYQWYRLNLGLKAAKKFNLGVNDSIRTLAQMPTIGRINNFPFLEDIELRSFVIHPKYQIIYQYTDKELRVIAIRATMMK